VGDEFTVRANREGFAQVQLVPRRLVDVRRLYTSFDLFGTTLPWPIILAPVGSQRAYHAQAELAVARAAKRTEMLQILSMGSSEPIDAVSAARGAPVWSQLYASRQWLVTKRFLKQAEEAHSPAVVLTVDIVGTPTGRERIDRYRRPHNPECQPCHKSISDALLRGGTGLANAVGLDAAQMFSRTMMLDWEIVDRIRDATSMKLIVKGILSPDDARLCVEHGVDGIIVSTHGGRAEDNGLSAIEALPAVVAAVASRVPVLVDSGFRRGTDVFKALALGATAVCIGRPYLWGLAAFGQEGVEAVATILRRELETTMRQMGTPTLQAIGPAALYRH
jgi:isopentenyl diphosphate isomerase/L-lactate dehydrogenase-like FMN-dependent dehydrogenase